MRPQRKSYGFRDDAIKWLRDNGFHYDPKFGWIHPDGRAALVEPHGRNPHPWVLTIYRRIR